ncbi:MAG: translation elongation factor Ts [Victivallaceae bacterium]|nr:translation elongation factor Ts [Victivallaceae bacterium]
MITAKMVSELRDKTGAGMMDCKRALDAANGDMELAIENLRKSGIAKAEKKSGRSTNQGKVWTAVADGKAAIIELLCETDFAAKTGKFTDLVKGIVADALKVDGDGDIAAKLNDAVKETLTSHIATIGENMQLRRAEKWEGAGNSFGFYHHMDGRVSVLVEAEGQADAALLTDVAMHIAAFNPRYVAPDAIPADVIAKEKEIALAADPKLAGKPEAMLEKILAGKINRFYSEVCLMQQPWFKDDKTTLAKINPALKIKRFVRWEVGEEL